MNVLIIDDNRDFCLSFRLMAEDLGYACTAVGTLEAGLHALESECFDVVFLDVMLPDANGIEALPQLRSQACRPEIVVVTATRDEESAEAALQFGTRDYLLKPLERDKLASVLSRCEELRSREKRFQDTVRFRYSSIIGRSAPLMANLYALDTAAHSDGNVLFLGETGTGKELFARELHDKSSRRNKRFVVVDCTNLPHSLSESLLFGHERGAFTDAAESRPGMISLAHEGTLFLDEVGDLDLPVQKSLLRVLQDKTFRPLSSDKEVLSDFRLAAATNRDLEDMVRRGVFRKDLYFRLSTFSVHLAPLRDQIEDIELLARHYIDKYCTQYATPIPAVSEEYLHVLTAYRWPGNVRELANVIWNSIHNLAGDTALHAYHLPLKLRVFAAQSEIRENERPASGYYPEAGPELSKWDDLTLETFPPFREARREAVDAVEAMYLSRLFSLCARDVKKACGISGLSRARLYELRGKHGI